MKKTSFYLIAFLLSTKVLGQITPFEILPHLMRGINLGNTFEAPLEGQWKVDAPIEWAKNGPAQEYYFDAYKEAGFQSVRIPVTWNTHALYTSPFTIDQAWIDRVEEVSEWALSRGLYVIINAHHESWLKENYDSLLYQERFDSIWSQIATHFKDKPESFLFEIINEPNGMTVEQVNELNARILGIIRKTNPTRIVLFSGNKWSNVDELRATAIPEDDYIIGYYHSYEPWNFAGLGQGTWGTKADSTAMIERIEKAKNWVDQHNIPVIIGEFNTDTLCDYNSKMRFLAMYVETALKNNIAFNAWDDGGTFQIYRRKAKTWHDTKEIFTNFSEKNPSYINLNVSDYNITIKWQNRLINSDSILIERRNSLSQFTKIAKVTENENSYFDENLIPEDYYYYRVVAFRNDSAFYSYPQRALIIPSSENQMPFLGAPFDIPGSFQAEDFDKGGYALSYFDSDLINKTNLYRDDKGCDIDTINNSYVLSGLKREEWFEYSINVLKTAKYRIVMYISCIEKNGGIIIISDGISSTSISYSKTDTLANFKEFSALRDLTEGEHILRFNYTSTGSYLIDSISILEYIDPVSNKEIQNSTIYIINNPVDTYCTIDSKNEIVSNSDIKLYSSSGSLIFEANNISLPYTINCQDLKKGEYFIQVSYPDFSKNFTIIKK